MAGFTFTAELFEYINTTIQASIGTNVAAINSIVFTVFGTFFSLYAVYFAYQFIFNKADFPLLDGLKQLALLGVVMMFASTSYSSAVIPTVLNLGEELGGTLTNTPNSAVAIDSFLTKIYIYVISLFSQAEFAPMSDDGTMFVSIVTIAMIIITTIPFAATTIGILLTAKIMVGILLSVGTIFVCFSFFPQTRHWFQSWVGLCLNYTLIVFMFPIALAIQMDFLNLYMFTTMTPENINIDKTLKIAITLAAFVAISVQIPVLASSLTGGVGINGMSGSFSSMIGGMKNLMGPLSGAGKGAGKLLGKGAKSAGRAGRGAYNKFKNRGNNIKAG
ncbi:hypothetical protein TUM4438_31210 [Shewanella sairae]|uniref:Type IV secretion system protein n=1 Tax=Shewanella sairae TaxID=190310 RepID=A0ABQ4PLB7_9GAMM|nr:type IV secretion system protein [Shewanella sairae]MCL1131891.1 type IV secretion system protein [Shewanella sairae]GIU48866.1 hypothetical protein TUM4438_31210 [Shewanella sairae]